MTRNSIFRRQNHIFFASPVTKNNVYTLNKEIHTLNKKYNEIKDYISTPKPIYLHINTGGGEVQAGWTAVDFIRNSVIPIHTIVEGGCASAGTLMSIVGKKRYMTRYARILIHQSSSDICGTFNQLEEEMKYLKDDMNETINFYHKYSKMSKSEIRNQLKHDHWWDFNTAKKNGLVDEEWKGHFNTD